MAYVTRDAVLDILAEVHRDADESAQHAIHRVWALVKELPDADVVVRKRGHWIDRDTNGALKCSVCKKYTLFYPGNFCPVCGTDMRPEPLKEGK